MRTLKVEHMGDDVQGVRLEGNPRNPEPMHFRVCFPGGDLEVVRAADGAEADYWIHVRVNRDGEMETVPGAMNGQLVDARLDVKDKHASETSPGDFAAPGLYHLAVRVRPEWPAGKPAPAGKRRGRQTEEG